MANEVEVHELAALHGNNPTPRFPALAKQTLTIAGAVSSAFNRSTVFVRVTTTTTCRLHFGAAPDGLSNTVLCYAGAYNDFEVIAGHKVIAVAA